MSNPDIRTPEQIQAELAATRAQMSATVDELVQTLKPSTQVRRASAKARTRALELRDQAVAVATDLRERTAETLRQATDGNRDAMLRVGVVAAATVGMIGLCVVGARRRRS